MGWTLVSNIKGPKGDTGPKNPEQDHRFAILEGLTAEPGTRLENLVIDPLAINPTATYGAGRADIIAAPGYGRANCNAVGATYVYPLAGLDPDPDSQFPAVTGDNVATRVYLKGHPTQDLGVTLSLAGYVWDGTSLQLAATQPNITSVQVKLAAGATLTLEAFGTIPTSDMTHFRPQLQFRRWGETYPQVGDFLYFKLWGVYVGDDAPTASPLPYVDGTMPDAFFVGEDNASASVKLQPKVEKGAGAYQRDVMVEKFKLRRGGVIGTNGLPAVALRFDHSMANFWAKVHPLLVKYNLPWVMAAYTDMYLETENQGTTWADLQTRAINTGGEVAYHSKTHLSAATDDDITAEIVTGSTTMKASLPRIPIEQFIPPGLGAGDWGGFMPGDSESDFYDTFAGRLIMQNFPVATGYIDGIYRPLPSGLAVGLVHSIMEKATPDSVDAILRGVVSAGTVGLVLMLHPRYLDSAGYITTAQLDAVLANVASRRDSGQVAVLSHSGLYVADPGSSYRNDLVSNGRFNTGFTSWSQTGNTVTTETGITFSRSGATGSALTQVILFNRESLVYGSTRELVYKVRATTGATVQATVTNSADQSKLNASTTHTLPASPNWVEVRTPLVIPLDQAVDSLTVTAGRVSGGSVDVTDIRLQAI